MTAPSPGTQDPLYILRQYRQLAPWNLRDLAALAGTILESSGVRPLNAAASSRPNERTIRFYVTRGLVTSPDGRGTAATYGYRHLLQLLSIKLWQMEGSTLASIADKLHDMTGDVLERRVAAALGPTLLTPHQLPLTGKDRPTFGRSGRALRAWLTETAGVEPATPAPETASWQRIPISQGVELHVHEKHPLTRVDNGANELADTIRLAVMRVLGRAPGQVVDSGERMKS